MLSIYGGLNLAFYNQLNGLPPPLKVLISLENARKSVKNEQIIGLKSTEIWFSFPGDEVKIAGGADGAAAEHRLINKCFDDGFRFSH